MNNKVKIYRSKVVDSIQKFYGELLLLSSGTIHTHLSALSDKMHEGLSQKESCIYVQFNNYNPNFLWVPVAELKKEHFSIDDCKHTIANEYSFKNWQAVESLEGVQYNIDFEKSVNAIVNGNLDVLKSLILTDPGLIHQRSQYGHKATLLHYTASNGIELWRQQVPENLGEIMNFLILSGADKAATMEVYGGQFTTLELLASSAHPMEAGLEKELLDILKT